MGKPLDPATNANEPDDSAGGLEALEQHLSHVPENSGLAFSVIQPLDPTHKAMPADRLQPCYHDENRPGQRPDAGQTKLCLCDSPQQRIYVHSDVAPLFQDQYLFPSGSVTFCLCGARHPGSPAPRNGEDAALARV
ncbi:MAG: chemotaxis protein CheB [Pelovirga sp.]